MDYFDVLDKRRSVRSFTSEDVTDEQVNKLISTSQLAPSAGNLQAYEVVVVRDEAKRKALSDAALGQSCVSGAPVVIAVCASADRAASRYGQRGGTLYCIQDATIFTTYLTLTAAAMGLSSVWVGAFDEKQVSRVLGAPDGVRPIALLPIGYAAAEPEPTPRRKYGDVVHDEKFA